MESTPNKPAASSKLSSASAAKPTPGKKFQKTRPKFSSPGQSFVTIVVGKEEAKGTFVVHKDLISYQSPFFKAAFESSLIEGKTQTIRLEDVETQTFGMLVHWLYEKEVDVQEFIEASTSRSSKSDSFAFPGTVTSIPTGTHCTATTGSTTTPASLIIAEPVSLAKLWTLARRFLIPVLQNEAMKHIHRSVYSARGQTLKNFISYAYEYGSGKTPLKRLSAARLLGSVGGQPPTAAFMEDLPRDAIMDFVDELAKEYLKISDGKKFLMRDVEEFLVETGSGRRAN